MPDGTCTHGDVSDCPACFPPEFWPVPLWAVELASPSVPVDRRITPTAVLFLGVISHYLPARGFPSMATIALALAVHERTVRSVVRDLETKGYLRVHRGSGRGHRTAYMVQPPGTRSGDPERGLVPLGHVPRAWDHPAFGAVLVRGSGRIVVTAKNAAGDRRTAGFAQLERGRVRLGAMLVRWARAAGGRVEAVLVRELERRVAIAERGRDA